MFITFEGIDGCGKSTQIGLLAEYLNSKGIENIMIREPGGTRFSEEIRKILLHSKKDINIISEMLLFEAARADLTHKVIKPALKKGFYVLSDRFYDSTTAYQGYGRGLPIDELEMIHKVATSGIVPDITFYLDLPLEVARKRFLEGQIEVGDIVIDSESFENKEGKNVRVSSIEITLEKTEE